MGYFSIIVLARLKRNYFNSVEFLGNLRYYNIICMHVRTYMQLMHYIYSHYQASLVNFYSGLVNFYSGLVNFYSGLLNLSTLLICATGN